jgi:hypothetical protein
MVYVLYIAAAVSAYPVWIGFSPDCVVDVLSRIYRMTVAVPKIPPLVVQYIPIEIAIPCAAIGVCEAPMRAIPVRN